MSEIIIQKEVDHFSVRLNRPDKHNAFTPEMISELTQFFQKAADNKFARAVVLTGAGPSFCSGADIDWMKSMVNFTFEQNRHDADNLYDMFAAAERCPLPIIGYVQGNVFGGGLGLVSICDIAIAEANAKFCFSEARLGLVPAIISTFVLKKMRASKAKELMITAAAFSAQVAYEAGLIEYFERELEAKEYLTHTLKNISNNGPMAVQEIKRLVRFSHTAPEDQVRIEAVRTIAERRVSDEGQEGLAAFTQKRKPAWVRQ